MAISGTPFFSGGVCPVGSYFSSCKTKNMKVIIKTAKSWPTSDERYEGRTVEYCTTEDEVFFSKDFPCIPVQEIKTSIIEEDYLPDSIREALATHLFLRSLDNAL